MADSNETIQDQGVDFEDSVPPGNHALEVAARAGFGPLSPLAQGTWHGQAVPCVSCGQLVRRDDPACQQCGQDLSEDMIRKMRQHAGPWFVLEHVRPFPGVSLERIVRQIRRGLITETSIVRGPSNDYQWRFAVETPGLCRYFGKCWCCHATVSLSDAYCPHCLHYLSFEKPRGVVQVPGAADAREPEGNQPSSGGNVAPQASVQPSAGIQSVEQIRHTVERSTVGPSLRNVAPSLPQQLPTRPGSVPIQTVDLARLSAAVRGARTAQARSDWDQPQRVGGVYVGWITGFLIVATVVVLLLFSRARSDRPVSPANPALPSMAAPAASPVVPHGSAQPPVQEPAPNSQPSPSTPQDPSNSNLSSSSP